MADGKAYCIWQMADNNYLQDEIHCVLWVQLIHNMLDLVHMFTSAGSISFHKPCDEA